MIIASLNQLLAERFNSHFLQNYTDSTGTVITVAKHIVKTEVHDNVYKFTVGEYYKPETHEVHVVPVENEIAVYRHYQLYGKRPMEKHDYNGDIMTVEVFHDSVQSGFFIDSDGDGYPCNKDQGIVWDCYLGVESLAALKFDAEVTHIVWYNK